MLGCTAYNHLPKAGQKKLDLRSQKCYLLGYEGSHQYRLWDPLKKTVIRARDVVFDESGDKNTTEMLTQSKGDLLVPELQEQNIQSPEKKTAKRDWQKQRKQRARLICKESVDKLSRNTPEHQAGQKKASFQGFYSFYYALESEA